MKIKTSNKVLQRNKLNFVHLVQDQIKFLLIYMFLEWLFIYGKQDRK